MSNEQWKEYKLGEIATFKYGTMPKKENVSIKGLYPIFSGYRIVGYYNEYNLTKSELIIVARGVGGTGDVKLSPEKCFLTNLSIAVFLNEEIISKKYAYYYFTLNNLRYLDSGSAQSQITISDLSKVPISLPPLPTQQKIAAILSSLDDKIELNNRINDNLEQQAQAIFKSWFVDFEPFGGRMPDGWRVGKLGEILRLKKNPIQPGEDTSLPYLPIDLIPIKSLAIREVRPNEEALSSLLRFEENDILIGAMRVYFHRVAVTPINGITRTTCFILEPFNPNYFAYGVITCNQDLAIDYAQKTSKGSTMPYAVWDGGLADFEIPIPDEITAVKFNDIVKPLLEQIKKSYFENKNLKELRDTLLPKLMSGEIEVQGIEI